MNQIVEYIKVSGGLLLLVIIWALIAVIIKSAIVTIREKVKK